MPQHLLLRLTPLYYFGQRMFSPQKKLDDPVVEATSHDMASDKQHHPLHFSSKDRAELASQKGCTSALFTAGRPVATLQCSARTTES